MAKGRLMMLLMSVLAIIQLFVFGLVAPFYLAVVVIVGVLNLLYALITGDSFGNIDLLFEPLMWALHQLEVAAGVKSDFRAAPYL